MVADAATTGIHAGVDCGEASRLAAEKGRSRLSARWSAVPHCCSPHACAGPAILIFAWLFPRRPQPSGNQILRKLYRNLGWLLAEFCQMPGYTAKQTQSFIRYEGLEHYLAARDEGKGVLILTGHLGAWELSSFYHSLMGYPMSIVIRRLDNPLVDNLVNHIRCLHGNQVLHKDDFARGLLGSMRRGETVGILMDTNMTPPQG